MDVSAKDIWIYILARLNLCIETDPSSLQNSLLVDQTSQPVATKLVTYSVCLDVSPLGPHQMYVIYVKYTTYFDRYVYIQRYIEHSIHRCSVMPRVDKGIGQQCFGYGLFTGNNTVTHPMLTYHDMCSAALETNLTKLTKSVQQLNP